MTSGAEISMPASVFHILQVLNSNKFEAHIVGGCVRDAILGKEPKDWDITTDATPGDIKILFPRTIDTGIKHGTVTVVIDNENHEITTYRIDGEYTDSRRPQTVTFTTSLEDDLSRRDFTINAIAYHPIRGFLDPFDGRKDINEGVIRAVGNADQRFQEDALRMLRAIRFSAQLSFPIHEDTLHSIKTNAHLIKRISGERIRDELSWILTSNHPERFILLKENNLLRHTIPEFEECFNTPQNNPHHVYDVGMHSICSAASIENRKVLRWTMLLHDIGKPVTRTTGDNGMDHFYGHHHQSVHIADTIMKRLRFDKRTSSKISRLIKHHFREILPAPNAVRKAVSSVGDDIFTDLLKVKEADYKGQNLEYFDERIERLNKVKHIYNDIKKNQHCLSIKELAMNGRDLIDMGYEQGKGIGKILDKLLDIVIENPELNNKASLTVLLDKLKLDE